MTSLDEYFDVPAGLPELLAAMLDGDLTAEQRESLNGLLLDSPRAQRFYIRYLSIHALLRQELSSSLPGLTQMTTCDEEEQFEQKRASAECGHTDSQAALESPLSAQEQSFAELFEEESQVARRHAVEEAAERVQQEATAAQQRRKIKELTGSHRTLRTDPPEFRRLAPYLVATALAASLLFMLPGFLSPQAEEFVEINSAPDASQISYARIVNSVDAQWEQSQISSTPGSPLPIGLLKLLHGVVEIEFGGGAQAVIEAPAEFRLLSPSYAKLTYGRFVGRVPEGALKLVVETRHALIVDLGTEFGVLSPQDGSSTDVHVFQGEIEMQSRVVHGPAFDPASEEAQAQPLPLQLSAGSSARTTNTGQATLVANLNPDRFIRKLAEVNKNTFPLGPLPGHTVPVTHDLVLWLAADGIVKKDAQGRVSIWGDLCVGANVEVENAEQSDPAKQPLWVANAIGNRPALRFDGKKSCLVTQSFKTTDDQTIFVAVQSDPTKILAIEPSAKRGVQILNYNGPPNISLEWSENVAIRGRNYCDLGGDLLTSVGIASGLVHKNREPVICGYVYQSSINQAHLYEDGRRISSATAPESAAITSQKFIGAHHTQDNGRFVGDMAELLIFNVALNEAEVLQVLDYLEEKYQTSGE